MSNINDILATINKLGGLAKPNRFAVQITAPTTMASAARDLVYLCDTVNLPDLQFQTEDIKNKGYGLSEKRPVGVTFGDVTATFFIDNNGVSLRFFQTWVSRVFSFNTSLSDKKINGLSAESYNYPADYSGTVQIAFMNDSNQDIIVYTLEDAYPTHIGGVTLGWEQNDQHAKLPVTFAYKTYTTYQGTVYGESDSYITDNPSVQTTTDYRNMSLLNTLNNPNINDVVARNAFTLI